MMLHRLLLTATLLLGFVHVSPAHSNECDKVYGKLKKAIYEPNKDQEGSQQGLVQSPEIMLRNAIASADKTSLEAIFEGEKAIGFGEIDSLFFAIKSGKIKAKPLFETYVTVLRDLGLDHPSLFNGKSDVVERMQSILNTSAQRHNSFGVSSDAAKLQNNLKRSEENLIIQAMREMRGIRNQSSRLFDGYRNTFDGHYERIKELVQANSDMRKVLNLTFVADEPIAYYKTIMDADFNSDEASILNGLLGDTRGKVLESMKAINEGYNVDLAQEGLNVGDQRLRVLEQRLADMKSGSKLENAVREAESDMDQLEKAVEAARTRKGLAAKDFTLTHDRQLQIRFDQHVRESARLASLYNGMISQKAPGTDYKVTASWTVTVHHSRQVMHTRTVQDYDSDGKPNGSHQEIYYTTETWTTSYGMQQDFKLKADYTELLNGKITPSTSEIDGMLPAAQTRGSDADYATNGSSSIDWQDDTRMSEIVNASKPLMDLENEVRLPLIKALKDVDAWIAAYDQIHESNSVRDQKLNEIDKELSDLVMVLNRSANKYAALENSGISSLWPKASISETQTRAKLLKERTDEIIARIEYFREQCRRQIENLGVYTFSPDYAKELTLLKRLGTQRWVWFGVKHTVLAAAIAGSVYVTVIAGPETVAGQKWSAVKTWFHNKFNPQDDEPVIRYNEDQPQGQSQTSQPEDNVNQDQRRDSAVLYAPDGAQIQVQSEHSQKQATPTSVAVKKKPIRKKKKVAATQ